MIVTRKFFNFDLDITGKNKQVATIKQEGFQSIGFEISLVDDGEPFIFADVEYVQIATRTPDGTIVNDVATFFENKITHLLHQNVMTAVGIHEAEVQLYTASALLITSSFFYYVQESVYDGEAITNQENYSVLVQLIERYDAMISAAEATTAVDRVIYETDFLTPDLMTTTTKSANFVTVNERNAFGIASIAANSGFALSGAAKNLGPVYADPGLKLTVKAKLPNIFTSRIARIGFVNYTSFSNLTTEIPTRGAYFNIVGNVCQAITKCVGDESLSSTVILEPDSWYEFMIEILRSTAVRFIIKQNEDVIFDNTSPDLVPKDLLVNAGFGSYVNQLSALDHFLADRFRLEFVKEVQGEVSPS